MAVERYGYSAINLEGEVTRLDKGQRKPEGWVVYFYYIENDGWSFIHRGPQRSVSVSVNPNVSVDDLRNALRGYRSEENFDLDVIRRLEEQLCEKIFER